MKAACNLSPFLLLLIVSSAEFAIALPVQGAAAHAIRIPEHTCHKLIGRSKCEMHKCSRACSKEPYGVGKCKGTICICTYYCKQPPQ